jgi:imidazole glycerol-phosphate synthase subunit HisH
MIIIIDYGLGNIGTIASKISKLDTSAKVSSDPDEISNADKLILPGVGYFKTGMENLISRNLIDILTKKVQKDKTPILGICLGMQLFTKRSEEGSVNGLGWIEADTVRFKFDQMLKDLKIPHMGWNAVQIQKQLPILKNIETNSRFYFVHSYHVRCKNLEDIVAQTHYGYNFPSIIAYENIFGVQFHPERSHKNGMQILKNFIEVK